MRKSPRRKRTAITTAKEPDDNSDDFSTQCFICSANLQLPNKKNSQSENEGLSKSLLSSQLRTIFTLNNILDLPSTLLENYLGKWGNPENWIKLCATCNNEIECVKEIFCNLQQTLRKFTEAKLKIQNKMGGIFYSPLSKETSQGIGGILSNRGRTRHFDTSADLNMSQHLQTEIVKVIRKNGETDGQSLSIAINNPCPPEDTMASESEMELERDVETGSDEDILDEGVDPPDDSSSNYQRQRRAKSNLSYVLKQEIDAEGMEEEIEEACDNDDEWEPEQENEPLNIKRRKMNSENQSNVQAKSIQRKRRNDPSTRQRKKIDNGVLSNRKFFCNLCPKLNKKEMDVTEFLEHFYMHKRQRVKCSVEGCDHYSSTERKFSHHWNIHHPELPNERGTIRFVYIASPPVPKTPWWCEVCNAEFESDDLRDAHFVSHDNTSTEDVSEESQKFVCEWCPKVFNRKEELGYHEGTAHVPEIKFVKCDECDEDFVSEATLKRHKLQNHETDLFKCNLCNETIKIEVLLTCGDNEGVGGVFNHRRLKHGKNEDKLRKPEVRCDICHRDLKDFKGLRRHIHQYHEGNYSVKCKICGKMSSSATIHRKHMMAIHTCSVCGETLENLRCLQEHKFSQHGIRTKKSATTGDISKICHLCGNEFKSTFGLRKHMKEIHGVVGPGLTGVCQECDLDCGTTRELFQHKILKHGRPKLQCVSCGEQFICHTKLKRHELRAHGTRSEKQIE